MSHTILQYGEKMHNIELTMCTHPSTPDATEQESFKFSQHV